MKNMNHRQVLAVLRRLGACDPALQCVRAQKGADARTLWETCACGSWMEWYLREADAWPEGAQVAYQQARVTAWAAYQQAIAPAWAAYEQAIVTARAAYQQAIVPAWAAYEQAIVPARAAYQQAIVDILRSTVTVED